MKPRIALSRFTRQQLRALAKLVAARYGFVVKDLVGDGKGARVSYARHFAMVLCRECTDCSLMELGTYFRRDHTIISAAEDKMRGFFDVYPREKEAYRAILAQVEKEGLDESRWPGPPLAALSKRGHNVKGHD